MPRVGLRARWAMPVLAFFDTRSKMAVPVVSLPVPANENPEGKNNDTRLTKIILTRRRHSDKWGKGLCDGKAATAAH